MMTFPFGWQVWIGSMVMGLATSEWVQAQEKPVPLTNPVTLTTQSRGGAVMVPTRIRDSEVLLFMLDTGYTMTMIRPDLAETLNLRKTGNITIVGIAGEEEASVFEGVPFDFSGFVFSPRRIAALPSESRRRRRRDGILGSGFFRRFVVELDAKAKSLKLYEPTNFVYSGKGEIVPLKFKSSTPTVDAFVNIPGRPTISAEFAIDTGCDSGVCVGQDFIEAHKLLDVSNPAESGGKFGVGGGAKTKSGHLPQVQLGQLRIDKPQTDFFLEGSPVDRGLAGHIGMETLRQYKVIFDYSRKRMILEAAKIRDP
jgi:predicted aspartyl protease